MRTSEINTSRLPSGRIAVVIFSAVAGLFVLMIAKMLWGMAWGFAGQETHFIAIFRFSNPSLAEITICPLEDHVTRTSVLFIIGASFLGIAVLLSKQRFSILRLVLVVVCIGAAGLYPSFSLRSNPPNTVALADALFDKKLSDTQRKKLEENLSIEALKSWKPDVALTSITAEDVQNFKYETEIGEESVHVTIWFARSPFERRAEIRDTYLQFFESQVSAVARDAGMSDVAPNARIVRRQLREK